jgi:hypothetical protein
MLPVWPLFRQKRERWLQADSGSAMPSIMRLTGAHLRPVHREKKLDKETPYIALKFVVIAATVAVALMFLGYW